MYSQNNVLRAISGARGVASVAHAHQIQQTLHKKSVELLDVIRSEPGDAATLDIMVRGRARLYQAAVDALTAIHSVRGSAAPRSRLQIPALDFVKHHVEGITGVRLGKTEVLVASGDFEDDSWAVLFWGVALSALALAFGTGSARWLWSYWTQGERAFDGWGHAPIWIAPLTVGPGVGCLLMAIAITFGLWRKRGVGPRDDVTLRRLAVGAGRTLAMRAPRRRPRSMLRYLPDGMGYWIVHSIALERASLVPAMRRYEWRGWDRQFVVELAMLVWVVATVAGDDPPALITRELGELIAEDYYGEMLNGIGRDLDDLVAGIVEGPDMRKDPTHMAAEMLGIGLVALAGGVHGIRALVRNGERLLRAGPAPYRDRMPG